MESGNRRFSLLLLDHDEVLFASAAATDVSHSVRNAENGGVSIAVEGRLWLCSRCVVFEPRDFARPLQKLRYKDMPQSPGGGYLEEESVLMFEATCVTEMKKGGKSNPYIVNQCKANKMFVLKHRSLQDTVKLVQTLYETRHKVLAEPRSARAALELQLLKPLIAPLVNQSFDNSRLVDFREQPMLKTLVVSVVSQLTEIPGCVLLTNERLYFQPAQLNNVGEVVQSFPLERLRGIFKRRYLLRHRALEIRFEKEHRGFSGGDDTYGFGMNEDVLLLSFEGGNRERDILHDALHSHLEIKLNEHVVQSLSFDQQLLVLPMHQRLANLQKAWQDREIGNFEYLMHLNTIADRSIADLTQYPVFPWVIADYSSEILDLNDPKTFRDLSKPIGALNENRLKGFKERYQHMLSDPDSQIPPFLYGTHYTTPGYVLYFLVRKHPDLMLRLQNGYFDRADRAFHTIEATWNSVMNNTADLKELIPEFYASNGDFLRNINNLDLGRKQDGEYVDDVVLPPWCESPQDFVHKCRQALESDHVSTHLHKWIDLVFGFKQRGEEAGKADNLFYFLTYEGAVDLDRVQDPNERKSYEAQIYEFGQTPKQLFVRPHPSRNDAETIPGVLANETKATKEMMKPSLIKTESGNLSSTASSRSILGKPRSPALSATSRSDWWKTNGGSIQGYGLLSSIKSHRGGVTGICASKDEAFLYSVSRDGSLTCVDLSTKQIRRRMAVGKLSLSSCEMSREEDHLLVGSWDNSLYACSIDFGRIVNRLLAHDDAISCMTTSKSGQVLATGSWESSIKIWTISSSRNIKHALTLYDHKSEITSIELDEGGNMCLSASSCGDVLIHDLQTADVVFNFPTCKNRETRAVAVHWVHNEATVAVLAEDGVVDMYNLLGGRNEPETSISMELPPSSRVTCGNVTTDRLCAVLGTTCGRVSLCNLNSLQTSGKNAARDVWRNGPAQDQREKEGEAVESVALRRQTSGKTQTEQDLPKTSITSLRCLSEKIVAGCHEGFLHFLGKN